MSEGALPHIVHRIEVDENEVCPKCGQSAMASFLTDYDTYGYVKLIVWCLKCGWEKPSVREGE